MPFPKNCVELREAGYKFAFEVKCKGCGKQIEFWRTPMNRMLPLDRDVITGKVTPHWATCEQAERFRRRTHGEKEEISETNPPTKTPAGDAGQKDRSS
jgi:hypothetical protein